MRNKKDDIYRFKNIVAMVFADGRLDELEQQFLRQKQKQFNLSEHEFKSIVQQGRENKLRVPQKASDREQQLKDLIETSWVDRHLDPQEYSLVVIVAELLEISVEQVNMIYIVLCEIEPISYFREFQLDINNYLAKTKQLRDELLTAS